MFQHENAPGHAPRPQRRDGTPAEQPALLRLQRLAGNRAASAAAGLPVQRLVVHAPGAGAGLRVGADDDSQVTITPGATYWVNGTAAATASFGNGQEATITVAANTSGILQLSLGAAFEIDNSMPWSNVDYAKQFFADFALTVDAQGQLAIGDGIVRDEGTDATTQLYIESVDPAKGADYVQVTARIVTGTSHGRTGGVGYEINQQAGGRSWVKQFRLRIQRPVVEPTVTIGPISISRTHRAHFERPRQRELTSSAQDGVIRWYQGLSETTRNRVRDGSEPVTLVGRASTTGSTRRNLELAEARMNDVQRVLRLYAGNRVVFHTSAEGEYGAGTEDRVEALEERRVDITVMETEDER